MEKNSIENPKKDTKKEIEFGETKKIIPIFIGNFGYKKVPLVFDRCFGITREGQRCKELTCLVHPFCTKCTQYHYLVEIYADYKKNLFFLYTKPHQEHPKDKPVFKKDSKIVPILGEVLTKEAFNHRYSKLAEYNAYLSHVYATRKGNYYIDSLVLRGPGYYARKRKFGYNARIEIIHDHCWLIALKEIYPDEEIIVDDEFDSPKNSPEKEEKKKIKSNSLDSSQSQRLELKIEHHHN
jgi:hypothetical protein